METGGLKEAICYNLNTAIFVLNGSFWDLKALIFDLKQIANSCRDQKETLKDIFLMQFTCNLETILDSYFLNDLLGHV